ncbi:hypothetical protein F5884DRAFT_758928 [Xylogone sp. PMI_703]|nr:hypothetical protein F5884DRAFT_758928 [Xylogone sp. PMI_703]
MNIEQSEHPMSPSSTSTSTSTSSTSASTPCSTQAPTSIKESLPSYGISLEDADKWNGEYNRESLPLMHEDLFWKLLKEIARNTDPADVESKLKSCMEQNSVHSRREFDKARYEIMLSGPELFQDESQKLDFTLALNAQHTVRGFEDFIAHCVPQLVKGCQQRKLKLRRQSITGSKQKKPVPRRVSKSYSQPTGEKGRRRSPRNKQPKTPSE